MKKVAISQPRYLPAANYIERIMISDIFVMLDNVQHQKRAYEHRNKVRTSNGDTWLSIPIDRKKSNSDNIKDLLIRNQENWTKNHLKTFKYNYKKTPYYSEIITLLENFYNKERDTLNSVVCDMLNIILKYLEIDSNIIWASNYEWETNNDDLLVEITDYFDGDIYISGPNGRNYIEENKFSDKNIDVLYHEYNHPVYEQVWGEFMEYMTVWDMMFYYGKETKNILRSGVLKEN